MQKKGFVIVLIALLLLVENSGGHLCLQNPEQGGGFPEQALTQASLPQCNMVTAPCGTVPLLTDSASYPSADSLSVLAVLNQQHLVGSGNISLSTCYLADQNCTIEEHFQPIAACTFDDDTAVEPPRVISYDLQLPSFTNDSSIILRAVYDTGVIGQLYYACSRIEVQGDGLSGENPAQCNSAPALVPLETTEETEETGETTTAEEADSSSEFTFMGFGIVVLGAAGGGLVLLILIVIVIIAVVCVVKRRDDDDYSGNESDQEGGGNSIPIMSLADIQSNRMEQSAEY